MLKRFAGTLRTKKGRNDGRPRHYSVRVEEDIVSQWISRRGLKING